MAEQCENAQGEENEKDSSHNMENSVKGKDKDYITDI
jgi:hypothetical protein